MSSPSNTKDGLKRRKPTRRIRSSMPTVAPGPDDDYWYTKLGGPTASGVMMSEDVAITLPALFCGLRNFAYLFAMLPFVVYRRLSSGGNERVPEHPLNRLWNESPDDQITSVCFRQALHFQAMLWGTGRAEVTWNRGGALALKLLPADRTETRILTNGRIVHVVRERMGGTRVVLDEDCVRIPSMGGDGITGFNLVQQLARESLGMYRAISDWCASYFGNSARPGLVVSFDGTATADAASKFKRDMREGYAGSRNRGNTLALWGGPKVTSLPGSNEDAQMVELLTYSVQDICRWLNMPPPFLMELSHATYANITELARWLVKYCMSPWFTVYEQEVTHKLLTEEERTNTWMQMVPEALLRGAPKERAEFYQMMQQNGNMTINEVRTLEDAPGIGEAGDQHFVPLNMTTAERMLEAPLEPVAVAPEVPLDDSNEPEEERPPGESEADNESRQSVDSSALRRQLAEALIPALDDVYGRMVGIERNECEREAKRTRTDAERAAWRIEYLDAQVMRVRGALNPIVDSLAGCLWATFGNSATEGKWLEQIAELSRATASLWSMLETKPEHPAEELIAAVLQLAEQHHGKLDGDSGDARPAGG